MNCVVEFKFDIGQSITLKDIGLPGTVVSLCQDEFGPTYRVVYWTENRRYTEWMYERELAE